MRHIFYFIKTGILNRIVPVFGIILIAGFIVPAAALPNYTEWSAGDITGKTLTPGLYSWGARVHVSADGVTVSGSANAVGTLQVEQDLILSDGVVVTLTGGQRASKVYWQVADGVTQGTGAAMKGIISFQTKIAVNKGATRHPIFSFVKRKNGII